MESENLLIGIYGPIASVSLKGYALPSGLQSFAFAPQSKQYVRVYATTIRSNPNDGGGRYRMQFAEIVVF